MNAAPPSWLVATTHDDCDICDHLVDQAVAIIRGFDQTVVELHVGDHLVNVQVWEIPP